MMGRPVRYFRDSFETILIAIFIALLVRTYFLTGYKVPGGTMSPTLMPGDLIVSFRPAGGFKLPLSSSKFGLHMPERGDLVVFTFPDQPHTSYVKRVLALAGDRVQMQQGVFSINDRPLGQERVSAPVPLPEGFEMATEKSGDATWAVLRKTDASRDDIAPLVVPPGEVFVIGDRRDGADGSRYWGTVPLERIEGRIFMVWFSLDWETRAPGSVFPRVRWERLFTRVH